jgi:cytochrome P450
MKFALVELKIALTKLVLNFEFELKDKDAKIEIQENTVRRPKGGMNIILKSRIQ